MEVIKSSPFYFKSIFSGPWDFLSTPVLTFLFLEHIFRTDILAAGRISTYLCLLSNSNFSGINLVRINYLTVSVSLESKHVFEGFSRRWQSKSHQGFSEFQLEKDPCHAHIVVDSIHFLEDSRLVECQLEAAIISLPYDSLYTATNNMATCFIKELEDENKTLRV